MTTEALAKALEDTAEAVINRWHSPDWKDARHTADFINALREALAAYRAAPAADGAACRPGRPIAPAPELPHPLLIAGGGKSWFTEGQMLAIHEQGRLVGRAQAAERAAERAAEICERQGRKFPIGAREQNCAEAIRNEFAAKQGEDHARD